jgi:hypothetical protein
MQTVVRMAWIPRKGSTCTSARFHLPFRTIHIITTKTTYSHLRSDKISTLTTISASEMKAVSCFTVRTALQPQMVAHALLASRHYPLAYNLTTLALDTQGFIVRHASVSMTAQTTCMDASGQAKAPCTQELLAAQTVPPEWPRSCSCTCDWQNKRLDNVCIQEQS